jgi:hypothetical protein
MTLIEKFTQIDIMIGPNHRTKVTEGEAGTMEYIADEFAIGFAEWMKWIRYDNADLYITHSTKELLEIFKKEKGL